MAGHPAAGDRDVDDERDQRLVSEAGSPRWVRAVSEQPWTARPWWQPAVGATLGPCQLSRMRQGETDGLVLRRPVVRGLRRVTRTGSRRPTGRGRGDLRADRGG